MTSAMRALVAGRLTVSAESPMADQRPFTDLEGVYLSSSLRGCLLELGRDGSFAVACSSQPPQRGKAEVVGQGFLIPTSRAGDLIPEDPPAVIVLRQPPQEPSGSTWPPSLTDPTKGPFVLGHRQSGISWGETLWLRPLRWGSRLYLVPADDDESFCRAVRSGLEPRRSPLGEQFLRRGDHRKRAGRRPPAECAAFK